MAFATPNPFKEIQFVLSLVQYQWGEFRYLKKTHLCMGFSLCFADYICSFLPTLSQYSFLRYESIAALYEFNHLHSVLYIATETLFHFVASIILQYALCTLYWTRRYSNNRFRNALLLDADYSLNPLDGFMMLYPWIVCPILICNVLLNNAIQCTFYFGGADPDLWLYLVIRSLILLP